MEAVSKAIRDKADRYLTQGRINVVHLSRSEAEFAVSGSAPEPYRVRFVGEWVCTCPAQVPLCAHVFACQKITRIEPARVLFTDDSDLSQFLHDALHERH